jgi:hypothetical protein
MAGDLRFVVSHPFRRKKRKGWGTVFLGGTSAWICGGVEVRRH